MLRTRIRLKTTGAGAAAMDESFRELERALASGEVTQEEFEQAQCRALGHDAWVSVYKTDAGGVAGDKEILLCRRCLAVRLEWQIPQDIDRCILCRSPVLMRKAGVCLDCGNKLTMPRGRSSPPPPRGHVMTGATKSGNIRHAAMRLPKMGSKTRVMSLCGSNLVDDSLRIDRTDCEVCRARLRTARARAREAEDAAKPPERDRVILLATSLRQAEIWMGLNRHLYPSVRFVGPIHTQILGSMPWNTFYYQLPYVDGGEIRYGYLLQLCEERGLSEWEPEVSHQERRAREQLQDR